MKFFVKPKFFGDSLIIKEIELASAIQSKVSFCFEGKKIVGRLDVDQRTLPISISILGHSRVKKYSIDQIEKFQVLDEGIADYFGPPIFTQ